MFRMVSEDTLQSNFTNVELQVKSSKTKLHKSQMKKLLFNTIQCSAYTDFKVAKLQRKIKS